VSEDVQIQATLDRVASLLDSTAADLGALTEGASGPDSAVMRRLIETEERAEAAEDRADAAQARVRELEAALRDLVEAVTGSAEDSAPGPGTA
jgi:hypothetical protein